jgi:hypothetical protein
MEYINASFYALRINSQQFETWINHRCIERCINNKFNTSISPSIKKAC